MADALIAFNTIEAVDNQFINKNFASKLIHWNYNYKCIHIHRKTNFKNKNKIIFISNFFAKSWWCRYFVLHATANTFTLPSIPSSFIGFIYYLQFFDHFTPSSLLRWAYNERPLWRFDVYQRALRRSISRISIFSNFLFTTSLASQLIPSIFSRHVTSIILSSTFWYLQPPLQPASYPTFRPVSPYRTTNYQSFLDIPIIPLITNYPSILDSSAHFGDYPPTHPFWIYQSVLDYLSSNHTGYTNPFWTTLPIHTDINPLWITYYQLPTHHGYANPFWTTTYNHLDIQIHFGLPITQPYWKYQSIWTTLPIHSDINPLWTTYYYPPILIYQSVLDTNLHHLLPILDIPPFLGLPTTYPFWIPTHSGLPPTTT